MGPCRTAWLAVLLGIGAPASAKDPLDQVEGTEDWGDAARAKARAADVGGPARAPATKPAVRERRILREVQVEIDQFEEDQFRFDQERRAFVNDRGEMRALREDRRARGAESRRGEAGRSSAARAATPDRPAPRTEAEALELEARRLEERAARNLERAEGLAPARAPAADRGTDAELAPKRGPRAADLDAARRSANQAFEEPPRAGRGPSTAEDARYEQEHRRAQEERARQDALRAQEEERRKAEEAARATREGKAAERRASEEAARKLGGRLDKDGQFVDPDLDSP